MNNADQVDVIRDRLTEEGAGKPEIVRQVALACLGWPYVFGAWGELCTPANRRKRARSDHPTITSKCQVLSGSHSDCNGCKWYPGDCRVRMFDCRGFTRWVLQQVGLDLTGQGATSQYNTAANWARRGKLSEMPDCVCCVFKQNGRSMEHTGLHIGGGNIIHCSSGVQTGKTSDRGWTHYAIPVGLYGEGEIPVETVKPTLRKGATGEDVVWLQERLTALGYGCGEIDGKFGTNTRNAVIAFQGANGLKPDGIVGEQTWAALDAGTAAVLYRVTCNGVTWDQYKRILEICPLAEAEKE